MIRAAEDDLSREFFFQVWLQPLLLTLQLMFVAVAIAAMIGIVGAWGASVSATNRFPGPLVRRVFLAAMVLTIALPMILHVAAWEATAGKFGWMIMTQTGTRAGGSSRYGFFSGLVSCGWIHGLVGGALVALACWHGTRQVASEVRDNSLLDCSPLAAWWRVRLPLASRWWIAALVATAMLAATEMTVVDLYGYRTIADEFYLFYAANPSLPSILMIVVVPLALVSSVLLWWSVSRRRPAASHAEREGRETDGEDAGALWRMLGAVAALGIALTMVLVPIASLIIKIGHEVSVEEDEVVARWSAAACVTRILEAPQFFAEEYAWTTILSLSTAFVAVAIAWPLAAVARTRPGWLRWLDLATITMVIIPGPVVAMTVVWIFQWDIPGFQFLYRQTIVPTVCALLARGIPVAYWILRAAYRGIEQRVIDAASLDMSWLARVWRIDRPMLGRDLLTALLGTAIVASGDVPATLPVIPPGVTTVGTRLFGLLHSGARYQEAALAIWYVAAITLVSLFLLRQRVASRVRLTS
jgi:iron(III) transport system permease protein